MESIINRAPKLDNCCIIVNLRTGCLIIGVLEFIFSALIFFGDLNQLLSTLKGDAGFLGLLTHSLSVVIDVLTVVIAFMLIVGVLKGISKYVGLWIHISIIIVCVNIILAILCFFLLIWVATVVIAINMCIYCYFVTVVINHYRSMEITMVFS